MPTNVLIVIPTLNEAPHIERVIARLLETPRPELSLRVVVADGGSTDGTRELVDSLSQREPRLRLMHNPDRIQSAGVNWAVRRYGREADVLIRCDAHADYPVDYCGRLVDALESNGADAVVVPLDSCGDAPLQKAIAWTSNSPIGTGGSAHRGGRQSGFVDHGHHAAFRMQSFRAAGGYDVSFSHNEDAELDCRQRALGARIYLDSSIRVCYSPRKTLASLYRQYFKYGEGRSRTVRRHPSSLRVRQLAVPGHLLLSGAALTVAPWQPLLLAWPALYLAVLMLVSCALVVRHRSAYALLCALAAATMHTAWALGFVTGLLAHRERLWARHMAIPLRLRPITGEIS